MRLEDLFPKLGRHRAAAIGGLGAVVLLGYLLFVLVGVTGHEPWFDEAQSWLLAKDASMGDLLLRYLRYEGHPPLWYFLLSIPAKLGWPYVMANVLSGLTMAVGVLLFLRLPAVPWFVRVTVPFGFFVVFQYAVVARAYALFLPAFMALAHVYPRRREKILLFTAILVVMSNISLHGLAIAWAFAALYGLELATEVRAGARLTSAESWRHRVATVVFVFQTAALLVVLWPPNDLLIGGALSVEQSMRLLQVMLPRLILPMLAINGFIASALGLFFLAWFWRQRVLFTFAGPFLAVTAITSLYSNYWHEGLYYFVWLFAFVLSLRIPAPAKWRRAALTLGTIVLLQHCTWAVRTLSYDVKEPYSGSQEMAAFIKANDLDAAKLYGVGFTTLALQPYFDEPLFDNYVTYGDFTFWDWSKSTPFFHPNAEATVRGMRAKFDEHLAENPDFIVIGYKFPGDRLYEQWMAERPNYKHVKRTNGALYWKNRNIEVESYDLFARRR